jgi:predicted unusual protein kinase regulating ubiquinone biosynthesis (AarF/ABC1/UbiB family)
MTSSILRAALPKLLRKKCRSLFHHPSTARYASSLSLVCLSQQTISSSEAEYQKEQTAAKRNLVKVGQKVKQITFGKIAELLSWVRIAMNSLSAIIFRFMYLVFSFSPAVLTSPILLLDDQEFRRRWWVILRDCIRQSGPCFTKFAQWISTRPDLFPLSVCKNLEDLQSNAAVHSWAETERALILSFGTNWSKSLRIVADNSTKNVTNGFRPAVLGSGCVAQVLLGQLDGQQVAVKIIHPGKIEV